MNRDVAGKDPTRCHTFIVFEAAFAAVVTPQPMHQAARPALGRHSWDGATRGAADTLHAAPQFALPPHKSRGKLQSPANLIPLCEFVACTVCTICAVWAAVSRDIAA